MSYIHDRYRLFFVVALLLAAYGVVLACGGGGGGGDSVSTSTTTPTPTTPTTTGVSDQAVGETFTIFKQAVASRNVSAIEQVFNSDSWTQNYKQFFEASTTDYDTLYQDLQSAEVVQEESDYVLMRVVKEIDGQQYSFDIEMIKEDGVWKILSM